MLNPYVLLAVGILWAASCGSAYLYGQYNEANACKAAKGEADAAAAAAAIKQHNENAVIDMQAAAEAETDRQKERVVFRDRVNTVERIVREKPSGCSASDDALRVLNDAINAANTPRTADARRVPTPAEASER